MLINKNYNIIRTFTVIHHNNKILETNKKQSTHPVFQVKRLKPLSATDLSLYLFLFISGKILTKSDHLRNDWTSIQQRYYLGRNVLIFCLKRTINSVPEKKKKRIIPPCHLYHIKGRKSKNKYLQFLSMS